MGQGHAVSGASTYFAEAGRTVGEQLQAQVRRSMEDPCIRVVLEAVDGYLLILNAQRQILAANEELLRALNHDDPGSLIGLRPGEAVNCLHFSEGPEGCGTSKQCASCGAVLTILASQADGRRVTGECRLSALSEGKLVAHDYRVTCTPLDLGGERLTAFVLNDISSEKRREVLEQTFLHDFANSIGGIEGWSQLLGQLDSSAAAREILALTDTLKDAVLSHQTLVQAERGELAVNAQPCSAEDMLGRIRSTFQGHPVRMAKYLEIEPAPEDARFTTDPALLMRVLTNMVKNAFEATPKGGAVRLWFEWRKGRPAFVAHNPGVIGEGVRPHIFERSFSTKAAQGRGIGTYCMKLYGERYLGGSVSFESTPATGTRFSIELPPAGQLAHHAGPTAPDVRANGVTRVLLAEDDESLSRLFTLFLEQLGLHVALCRDGEEALEAVRAAPDDIDLLITDGKMPRMGGLELGREVRAIRPDLPMLYCTGSSPGVDLRDSLDEAGFRGLISKPFSIPSLASALNAVIPGCARNGE
jgi:CheY-like chemotaxis protein